jgi:hypothetical protein
MMTFGSVISAWLAAAVAIGSAAANGPAKITSRTFER